MKTCATVAALAAGANALALRGESCCFTLTASGGTSGTVGQLNDGQNRIGGGLPPATFCITPGGTITDSSGRGCILTRKWLSLIPVIVDTLSSNPCTDCLAAWSSSYNPTAM